ncbi:MAG: hypothetical protein AAGF82_07965 [Pseudomonadota bacterium]
MISPEACHNTTDRLASSMSAAMNIPTQNIRVFVDEDAAGPNVLQAISDYSATVGPQDEILMYVTGHGAPYADWVNAWVQDAGMREMMAELRPRGEYLLQFWTETPDTVPGLAVVNESLMPVTRLLDAFGDFEGRLALIVESCSSGLLLENPDYLAQRYPFLDHLTVTSGPDQGSNLTEDESASLFADSLSDTLASARNMTFVEVIDAAAEMTLERVVGICENLTISREQFSDVFPQEALPSSELLQEEVRLPTWYCHQTPASHSFGTSFAERMIAPEKTG